MAEAHDYTGTQCAGGVRRTVAMSSNGEHRYLLKVADEQRYQPPAPLVWVMLNPSVATETVNDKTMTRVWDFTRREGYTEARVINLASRITPYAEQLRTFGEAGLRGPNYWTWVHSVMEGAKDVVFAWGQSSKFLAELKEPFVRSMWEYTGVYTRVWCLGYTKDGDPRHPLMLKKTTDFELMHRD